MVVPVVLQLEPAGTAVASKERDCSLLSPAIKKQTK